MKESKEIKNVDDLMEAVQEKSSFEPNMSMPPKELLEMIPRPGEVIHSISSYPVNENEEFTKKTIKGYSVKRTMVRSSALTDSMEEVVVNGDFRFPLEKRKTLILSNGDELYLKAEDAVDRWRVLMNESLSIAKKREEEAVEIRNNLEVALKEGYL